MIQFSICRMGWIPAYCIMEHEERALGKMDLAQSLAAMIIFVFVFYFPHRCSCWGPQPIKESLCKAELPSQTGCGVGWRGREKLEGSKSNASPHPQDHTKHFPCRNWLPPKGRGWEEWEQSHTDWYVHCKNPIGMGSYKKGISCFALQTRQRKACERALASEIVLDLHIQDKVRAWLS